MQNELSSNVAVSESLQRLSAKLHALLHSMAGEDPSDAHKDGELGSSEETESLLDRLLDNREDWAMERESEISRLEKENEELRKMLGIDKSTVEEKGWLEEEARELATTRYIPMRSHSPRSPSTHPLPRGSPSITPFVNLPGMNAPPGPQQRPMDPGTGLRIAQGRRPAMFGQRWRGGGPPLWEGASHAIQATTERPWQAQV